MISSVQIWQLASWFLLLLAVSTFLPSPSSAQTCSEVPALNPGESKVMTWNVDVFGPKGCYSLEAFSGQELEISFQNTPVSPALAVTLRQGGNTTRLRQNETFSIQNTGADAEVHFLAIPDIGSNLFLRITAVPESNVASTANPEQASSASDLLLAGDFCKGFFSPLKCLVEMSDQIGPDETFACGAVNAISREGDYDPPRSACIAMKKATCKRMGGMPAAYQILERDDYSLCTLAKFNGELQDWALPRSNIPAQEGNLIALVAAKKAILTYPEAWAEVLSMSGSQFNSALNESWNELSTGFEASIRMGSLKINGEACRELSLPETKSMSQAIFSASLDYERSTDYEMRENF
ncbi:MAG: hypothetical protein AAGL66_10255, partial [Pseudomonadota bacterium]